jgi:hypothetical protein|tara:strand:+ start:651 stop:1082 length:432 start_codon:yes stop_codon:yes gene_type:complete
MLSELITKETKSVMKRALLRFSKEKGIAPTENQLLICGGPEGSPSYKYMRNYTPEKSLTFNEILGVTFDFKSREILATPFMQNAIMRLSTEKEISPEDIQIMIFTNSNKCKEINLFAYTNGKKIQPVTFEWLFREGVELKDLV